MYLSFQGYQLNSESLPNYTHMSLDHSWRGKSEKVLSAIESRSR